MKYRNGFVSNSSSSSFLLYGICVDPAKLMSRIVEGDVTAAVLAKTHRVLAWSRERGYTTREDYASFAELLAGGDNEVLYNIAEAIGVEAWRPYGEGDMFVGVSWDEVGDDETGAQFKERVRALLESVFGPNLSFGTYEYAWRDC